MMARVQVALPPEDHRRARTRAAELGISFAEYVRRLVVRDLGEPQPRGDISAIFDLGSGGPSDIARDKDEMVGEAVEAEYLRKVGRSE